MLINSQVTIAEIQAAIAAMLQPSLPWLQAIGLNAARSLILIQLALLAYRTYFAYHGGFTGFTWDFLRKITLCGIVLWALQFYTAPWPVLGASTTDLITDGTSWVAQRLERGASDDIDSHLLGLWQRILEPSRWDITGTIAYWGLTVAILLSWLVTILLGAGAQILTALTVTVGPLLLPTALIPAVQGWALNWLRSLVQYSFFQIVVAAYLWIGATFIDRMLFRQPPGVVAAADILTYLFYVFLVLGVYMYYATKLWGFTSGLFQGAMAHGDAGLTLLAGWMGRR